MLYNASKFKTRRGGLSFKQVILDVTPSISIPPPDTTDISWWVSLSRKSVPGLAV